MAEIREDAWLVRTPLAMIVVDGVHTVDQARTKALEQLKLGHKPYLAKDWQIERLSVVEPELRQAVVAQMDGYRPSKPTAATAKRAAKAAKSPSQRLAPKKPKQPPGQGSML